MAPFSVIYCSPSNFYNLFSLYCSLKMFVLIWSISSSIFSHQELYCSKNPCNHSRRDSGSLWSLYGGIPGSILLILWGVEESSYYTILSNVSALTSILVFTTPLKCLKSDTCSLSGMLYLVLFSKSSLTIVSIS